MRKKVLFLLSLISFCGPTHVAFSENITHLVPIGLPVAMQVKTEDSLISGMGTITYFNPQTNKFAALGHGIMDVDTKDIVEITEGYIFASDLIDIKKGEEGTPGELKSDIDYKNKLGKITKNRKTGIYGELANIEILNTMLVAKRTEIERGEAVLLSSINGELLEYSINVENVNPHTVDPTKSFIIKIEDDRLIDLTGGIIQGMSGSPILQNGKIIGAVTHVFVSDPTKGYGIFIESMLECEMI
ncbi:MAG: hypothetical protein FWE02_01365 [Defluviitaleaceae bacterium]|nr:hypothetical protein [Defluviitaleaceae bacterium]